MQREVETGRSVADVGVGWRVNGQQEVVDQLQKFHVRRRPENLLDDFDKRQADVLWDGSQMLIPMLLERSARRLVMVSEETTGIVQTTLVQ